MVGRNPRSCKHDRWKGKGPSDLEGPKSKTFQEDKENPAPCSLLF